VLFVARDLICSIKWSSVSSHCYVLASCYVKVWLACCITDFFLMSEIMFHWFQLRNTWNVCTSVQHIYNDVGIISHCVVAYHFFLLRAVSFCSLPWCLCFSWDSIYWKPRDSRLHSVCTLATEQSSLESSGLHSVVNWRCKKRITNIKSKIKDIGELCECIVSARTNLTSEWLTRQSGSDELDCMCQGERRLLWTQSALINSD